jgi:hypothetical protein
LVPDREWHLHHLSGGSSQVLAVALLGSAIERDPSLKWLAEVLSLQGVFSSATPTCAFEKSLDPETLNELERTTSVDLLVEDDGHVLCIEAKMWEAGFGTCRCGRDQEEHALDEPSETVPVPAQERGGCSTKVLKRPAYWAAATEVLGLPELVEGKPCPIASSYQAVRNLAAARALEKGRRACFALFFDARNPYFRSTDSWPGWPALLAASIAPTADVSFRSCSWQVLLGSGAVPADVVDWAHEKHGLEPAKASQ